MQFRSDQDQTSDTQCCFFNSVSHKGNEQVRPTRDGLVGLEKPKLKSGQGQQLQKSSHIVGRNQHQGTGSEKGKINLSKLVLRRTGNFSRDHCEQKQSVYNLEASHASACKSKVSESKPSSSVVGVDFSFNQQRSARVYHQPQGKVSFANLPIQQYPLRTQPIQFQTKIQRNVYEGYAVGSNLPPPLPISYRAPKNVSFQYSQPQPQPQPQPYRPVSTGITELRPNPLPPQSQRSVAQDRLISSTQLNSHEVSSMNIKGVQTISPTLETDRKTLLSQARESQMQEKSAFSPGSAKNTSHIFERPQSEYAESRMVETVMPNLGRTHLKTVQSVYGSEIGGGKKEMQESVILIDFFNPSEHLRKEIEEKIFNQRYPDYNF